MPTRVLARLAPTARRSSASRLTATAALLALALAAAGCGRPAHPPASPAPPPSRAGAVAIPETPTLNVSGRPISGYIARLDSLPAADPALLAGKRVVIDPGHGGYFRGCIGVNGLTEAEVNLGVSLRLRDLLVARGATVKMTRERDRDFLTPSDSTLKTDLAERARIANEFAPDVFVSVHHNADPSGRHDVNETQTYYRLGDEGPSYDLGTDLHRSMVRNLGIEVHKLLPGNFSVVRNSEAPSVLTEASYLTHPEVEARLRTPEAQQLEAEAILTGLTSWFARRRPVVDSVWFEDRFDLTDEPFYNSSSRAAIMARIRGGFDEAVVRLDGAPVPFAVSGDLLTAVIPEPLAIGRHVSSVSARLAGEGAAIAVRDTFEVSKAANIELTATIPWAWASPSPAAVPFRIEARDVDGVPWPDSAEVILHVVEPRSMLPRDTVVWVRDGIAWAYFRLPVSTHELRGIHVTMQSANDDSDNPSAEFLIRGPVGAFGEPGQRTGFAVSMPGDLPLREAPGTQGWSPRISWINRDGFVAVRSDSNGEYRTPKLAGYRHWGAETLWPPHFTRIAGGVLRGKRIALDPEGGGEDAAGMGRSGTRAATLNLEVARALGAMLEAAGAEVALTRSADAAVSELERVQVAERFRADRYLRIGHAAAPPIAGYYFSSGGGRRWAQTLARTCAELGLGDSLATGEAAKYALTQASAVALYASLARVDSASSEDALHSPGRLRAEAYALYVALAREYAGDAATAWRTDTLLLKRADGTAASGALVTLGGALVLQADRDGIVRFVRTESGPLQVRGADSRSALREVLLDSDRARTLTGAR